MGCLSFLPRLASGKVGRLGAINWSHSARGWTQGLVREQSNSPSLPPLARRAFSKSHPGRACAQGPGRMRLLSAAGAAAILLPLTACAGNPPQIVDYSPQRGAVEVSTAAPIKIAFDHDVDQASVESRLHLVPASLGTVQWESAHELLYTHSTLQASTTYEVVLDPGYPDLAGNTYSLRHHWSFVTEGPPNLAASTPSDSDTAVDPAAYITLNFTPQMNPNTLRPPLPSNPSIPFDVRVDP